jgi:hypothetical protein
VDKLGVNIPAPLSDKERLVHVVRFQFGRDFCVVWVPRPAFLIFDVRPRPEAARGLNSSDRLSQNLSSRLDFVALSHEPSEGQTAFHWVRFAAFVVILLAIIDKNRR